ncbi:transferase family [Fusarium subglutinans]|uniref:Transferase family n=1 Tax=Gibberella subglutinans TaxID=42677 RepID=A0A8H5PBQ1_GIBSU|nr:transferase family [Fusarium subglutinans]KAF5593543.1 transferase family [Fusarium subglutinans]
MSSLNISDGFQDISARAFANAVNKTAWWLYSQIGENNVVQTAAYIGPQDDLRHVLLTYACVKVGCTALFLSPRNSIEGALAVLEAAKCSTWVKPYGYSCPLADDILQKRSIKVLILPELDEMLNADPITLYPYDKTFEEASGDPFCLLHTSGSTGLPKPITWSHGLIGTMDAVRLLPRVEGDDGLLPWTDNWNEGDRIYSSFPMSHGAGIIMNILLPSLFGLHCIMGPKGVVPNMDLIESLADHANIAIWIMVPSLVDELGETPDVLIKLKPSKFICASGGPVSPILGSKGNDVVRVLNLTGTTEGLFIGNLWIERQDWYYFSFHPFSGFEFREVEPGIYEHWVHSNTHWPLFQGIFHTLPNEASINLKDLYSKHPTKPNLWAFQGRNDDIVVLSNGYKISPLETEALVSTHPDIKGCLMVGTGKRQAGLLIELQDSTSRTNEVLDSVWAAIERANALSLHKNQVQRDYVAFAEFDKPFIRTDKGTIERRATLEAYGDFIERFYSSRMEKDPEFIAIDTSSIASVTDGVRHILDTLSPAVKEAALDDNLFVKGLTQCWFSVLSSLCEQLPSLFSAMLVQLAIGMHRKTSNEASSGEAATDGAAEMYRMIDLHRARLSQRVSPFDQMSPNIYLGMKFFYRLRKGVRFEDVFARLQTGLRRAMEIIPELDGKLIPCSEDEIGYKKGSMRITLPPVPYTSKTNQSAESSGPRQLRYEDLSVVLSSFAELRAGGFLCSSFVDDIVLASPLAPSLPADVFMAQANFIHGGCILAIDFHHQCFDGTGAIMVMRIWGDCCRHTQGEATATCDWLDKQSMNRSIPQILHELEGYAKPADQVDKNVWGFIDIPDPAEIENGTQVKSFMNESTLPPAPFFPRKFEWPPTRPTHGRPMKAYTFVMSTEMVEKLWRDVLADPTAEGVTSVSDMIQAFVWRSAIKARYHVATHLRCETFDEDEMAIVELPIDVRPYFSKLLPESYMGNLVIINRPSMPVATLCGTGTTVGQVAQVFRAAAVHIKTSLVHDAFTLLQSVPDYTKVTTACMGMDGMHFAVNNLMLFQTSAISFGDELLDDGGVPAAMRIQMDSINAAFRMAVIHPLREDGGIEFVVGMLPEELDAILADGKFTRYCRLIG